jgi:hypothetical protein
MTNHPTKLGALLRRQSTLAFDWEEHQRLGPWAIDAQYLTLLWKKRQLEMSKSTKYLLVSLPTSISPSHDRDEALTALRSTISTDHGTVFPFKIPDFKIGTLDALVQQADDLAKLEGACEAVVAKVGDSIRSILEGDEAKISQQKTVNDSMIRSMNSLDENLWLICLYRAC